ncbi:hypothetical protein AB0D10_04470 [Kitasatospora sp. NPDC048545]|uniref:hypothetical protein n=1 Tax=Kitasatospora sp. NPDC048545 TaxID=3157208 RepID=UPI0033E19D8B
MDESQSDGEITRNAPKGSPFRGGAFRGGALRGAREWVGWLLVAAGAVLCVLGWYGVSGEPFVEQQVPYLASSTIPGAALIVAGAVVVALRPPAPPEHGGLTDRRVERLYELLVEPSGTGAGTGSTGRDPAPDPGQATGQNAGPAVVPDPADTADTAGPDARAWLAVPEGTRYHRPDCPLVTGKARAAPVGPDAVRARGLTPCPLCSPRPPDRGPDTRPGGSAPPAG